MLHVTNGDCAADVLRAAALEGAILPWRDVLHEGPVPAGLSLAELSGVRGRFLASLGWLDESEALRLFAERDATLAAAAVRDEVVLWFEHDLYDQLQLVQLLDYFADAPRSTTPRVVCVAEYLGEASAARLRELFPARAAASDRQLDLGRRAWAALRSPDPRDVAALLDEDTSALPFLAAALRRHLEQLPSLHNGLSRSEEQALRAIASGATRLRDAFVEAQRPEEARFLGDASFALYLERLSAGAPLVLLADGGRVVAPRSPGAHPSFWDATAALTDAGRAALAGARDRVRADGVDRWLGGVHLEGREVRWRWDADTRRLRDMEEG
ncbi:MAG: DUF1835 domain-containing protein [Thermodesulfobacteriota bacterium]